MSDYVKYTDGELLDFLKNGDKKAFAEIYGRYASVLFLHAQHMLREDEQAKDVIQELFTVVWNKRLQIGADNSLRGYLYRAVRNNVLNVIRRGKVQENYIADFSGFVPSGGVEADERVRYNELKRMIEEEVDRMPKKMRVIFEMSRKEHLSHAEIAMKLGISESTVKKQVSNAVRILKKKFGYAFILFFFN